MAREKLSRAEQRFNYGIAILTVAVVALLVLISPNITVEGTPVPVLVLAILVGAFLFGLGQMAVGLSRRRRYLRSLPTAGQQSGPEV